MQIAVLKIVALVALFVVTVVFAILPIKLKNVRKGILRSISCFCGGLFLGVCFLHLVPDVVDEMQEAFEGKNIKFPVAEFTIVVGLLLVLTIEKSVSACQPPKKTCKDSEDCCKNGCEVQDGSSSLKSSEISPLLKGVKTDVIVKYDLQEHICTAEAATESSTPDVTVLRSPGKEPIKSTCCRERSENAQEYKDALEGSDKADDVHKNKDELVAKLRALCMVLALSIHSFLEGLVIGLQDSAHNVTELLVLIGFHKSLVAFSLGVTLLKAGASKLGHVREAVIFALASPLGTFVGLLLTNYNIHSVQMTALSSLTGLATGTFLYVTFFEILGQGLKGNTKHDLLNAGFCILGFLVFCGVVMIPGGGH